MRVELWDVAGQRRARLDEPSIEKGCFTTMLAPDARTLACLRHDDVMSLIELPSGAEIFEKNGFVRNALPPKFGFSPDGRYFLAAQRDNAVGFDIRSRQNIRVPSEVKRRLADGFVFLGPDRLLVTPGFRGVQDVAPMYFPTVGTIWADSYHSERQPATLFAFPSGKVIDHLPLGWQNASAPAHGDYVVLRPIKDHPVGVMDLRTKKVFLADKQQALDICDEVFVDQRPNGELALYDAWSLRLHAHTRLPVPSDAHGISRAFVSPGLKWLAASEGPIWDLTTGQKLYELRRFQSGWFDGDKAFYADFPKLGGSPRTIARVDLTRQGIMMVLKIEEPYAWQSGSFLAG